MDKFEHNRESWNELTALHADSGFYNIERLKLKIAFQKMNC